MLTCSPSEQGVAATGIAAFLDAIEAHPGVEPHGLIIHRHGRRIAEGYWAPHARERIRLVYSLSKTFTGTALALLLGEGRLSLDDRVADHLPEAFDGIPTGAVIRRLKIRHIASMATGHDRETLLEAWALDRQDPVRGFLRIPPDAEPGTLFAYNQPPVIALATILQRLCGQRLLDYLRPRLLDPIGVDDLRWAQLPGNLDMGFSGVHSNLDTIARLGQLYLDDGVCEGRRLLPGGWVAQASAVQVPNPQRPEPDWQQGYGFQLWMSQHGYRGDGAFGQYMVVLPEHDAVVAMFSCTEDMQVVLDLVWEHLLPAMDAAVEPTGPADDALASRLATLSLPTMMERLGGGAPSLAAMTLTPGRSQPAAHRTVSAISTTTDGRMILHERDGEVGVPLTETWSVTDDVASSATRLGDGRLAVDVVFLATPHRLRVELDPATGTFTTEWPLVPLFGAGLDNRLSSMHAPD